MHTCNAFSPNILTYLTRYSGLEFATVVFWLTTFALLADETKWWDIEEKSLKSSKKFCDQYSGSDDGDACGEVDKLLSASKASKAATAFAALTWLLFMVTFGFLGEHSPSISHNRPSFQSLEC